MSKDRSLVRASDIGAWSYCHRAWWLDRVEQVEHRNPAELQAGNRAHRRHGYQVAGSQRLYRAGLLLLSGGLMLSGLALLAWLFWG